jgi:hypothetical protein
MAMAPFFATDTTKVASIWPLDHPNGFSLYLVRYRFEIGCLGKQCQKRRGPDHADLGFSFFSIDRDAARPGQIHGHVSRQHLYRSLRIAHLQDSAGVRKVSPFPFQGLLEAMHMQDAKLVPFHRVCEVLCRGVQILPVSTTYTFM